MTLTLRSARADDYDAVFDLFSELQQLHVEALSSFFKPPSKNHHFRGFFDNVLATQRLHLTLALQARKPVGYVHFGVVKQPEDLHEQANSYVYIQQIIVSRSVRRSGIGSALLEHVKSFSRERGLTDVGIDFWVFNESARRCFEKAGFSTRQHIMWLET